MDHNALSSAIIAAAIEVHRELGGPGLLESIYGEALVHELTSQSIRVDRQVLVQIAYKGTNLATPLRIDLLVDDSIIVELKAVEQVSAVSRSQLLTYLRLADKRLGLLINFGETLIKDGIHRVVNRL